MAIKIKEIGKTAVNTILTAGQFYATWAALVEGNRFAWNIIVFLAWVTFIFSILGILLCLDKDYKRRTRPAIREKLSLCTDIAMAVFFAAFGHFFYASLTLAQQLLEQFCYETQRPAKKVQGV